MSHPKHAIGEKMLEHYESYWSQGDPWGFEGSAFDRDRFQRQLNLVADRRYRRALDLGCGSGHFTRLLCDIADEVTAIDIAPSAVARAKSRCADRPNASFQAANIMEFGGPGAGPWDLVVMSETIYCLGWGYSMFEVGWLVSEYFNAMPAGGRFLLVNTIGNETDYLLLPWLIKTYRDLFLNVGFAIDAEQALKGRKNDVDYEVLMTLLQKPQP